MKATMTIPLPELTPEVLAKMFWELDDAQQARFFDALGTIALTTPTPFSREIGSMAGLDMQMFYAAKKCTPLGRDVMSRFSDPGVNILRPLRGAIE